MILDGRSNGSQARRHRADRAHRHAARALDLALCQHANGSYAALAWAAADSPGHAVGPTEIEWYQQARALVHSNGGHVRADDAKLLVATMRWKGGAAR